MFCQNFRIFEKKLAEGRAYLALDQFLFKNSEILSKHSLCIDTSFATMSDPLPPNLVFLVQAKVDRPPLLDHMGAWHSTGALVCLVSSVSGLSGPGFKRVCFQVCLVPNLYCFQCVGSGVYGVYIS